MILAKWDQRRVACGVPQGVIQVFEPVEVGIDQRALLDGDQPERFIESSTIVEARERVDRRRPPLLVCQERPVNPWGRSRPPLSQTATAPTAW
jgi:hypothetical protein